MTSPSIPLDALAGSSISRVGHVYRIERTPTVDSTTRNDVLLALSPTLPQTVEVLARRLGTASTLDVQSHLDNLADLCLAECVEDRWIELEDDPAPPQPIDDAFASRAEWRES